jgi:serine protease Do
LSGTPDIAALAAKVKPVVVNITTTHTMKMRAHPFFEMSPEGDEGGGSPFPFPFPFRRGPREGAPDSESSFQQRALGTGFIVDNRGHVVTNAHVIAEADTVRVKLADERELNAKVVGRDDKLDLAVLELVGATDLPVASLGSSESLRVGEYVVAIGNPFGLGHTVTMGIVSAKSRTIGAGQYDDFIQTDASINPGNSGGPLFDLRGQVVGINTAINPAGRGIGFAIPVDMLKDILPQLIATGSVSRGRLGVTYQNLDEPLAKALGMDRPRGAVVGDVEKGSAAEKAGLRSGDVIVGIDATAIASASDLPKAIARRAPGTKTSVKFLRDKAERTVEVVLDEIPTERAERPTSPKSPSAKTPTKFGIALGESRDGVVVERVEPGSKASEVLRRGDVIVEVNKTPVANPQAAAKALESAKAPVLAKVRRGNVTRWIAIEK